MPTTKTSAVSAGQAIVEILANDSKFQQGLSRAQAKLKAFSAAAMTEGTKMFAGGVAMSAPFVQSARVLMGFADQMSVVRAVTSATGKDFSTLNDKAKELGANTSFTAGQVASAMVALGRAGYTTNEILQSIAGTLDLARAGALDLGEATTIMADTSRSFGLAADQAGRVGDILAKTANISNTDIQMIGDAMKYVAASANLSGQSIERVSSALAVMANRGLKGEMSGASMAMALSQLAGSDVQAKLKGIGVNAMDAQGNMRDLVDIVGELKTATASMGNAQKLSLFKDLFDQRGMRSMIMLTENIDEWKRLTDVIGNAGGTASRVAKEMDDNLGGSFRILMSAVEGTEIAIGDSLEPALREYMASLTDVAGGVTEFVKTHEDLVSTLAHAAAAMTGTGASFMALIVSASAVTTIIGGLKIAASGAGVALTLISAHPLIALATAASAAYIAYRAFSDITISTTSKMADLSNQTARNVNNTRSLIDELERLGEKTALTNSEQDRAKEIVSALEAKYGKLAISIDAVTGKITGLSSGMKTVNKSMDSELIERFKNKLKEVRENIQSYRDAQQQIAKGTLNHLGDAWNTKGNMFDESTWKHGSTQTDKLEGYNDEIMADMKRAAILEKKIRDLEAAQKQAEADSAASAAKDAASRMDEESLKKLNQLREDSLKSSRTQSENEIAEIRKTALEYQKLIDQKIEIERMNGNIASDVISALEDEKARAIEVAATRIAAITDEIAKRKELSDQQRRDAIEEEKRASQERARQLAEQRAEERRQQRETVKDANKSVADSIKGVKDRRDDEKLDDFLATASTETLTVMFQNAQAAAERYRNVMQTMAEDFSRDGVVTDDEREMLDASREDYEKAESVADRIRDAMEKVAKTFAVTGSFNSKALAQNVPMNPVEDKQLALAKEQTDLIRRLVEGIDAGGVLIVGGN